MKYIVEIRYRRFTFDNGTTALSFAELAQAHADEDNRVTITLEGGDEDDER